jgi:hypothetical protein
MLPSPSIIAALAVTALPLFPAASVAAPLCRWVDEAGRAQISDESAGCCGPFRTTRGAIKPDAFGSCNVIQSPAVKCGPRRN